MPKRQRAINKRLKGSRNKFLGVGNDDPKRRGPKSSPQEPVVRGFASTKDQAEDLLRYGVTAKDVYLSSRGSETLEACLDSFRDRPGRLIVAADLRLFGKSKSAVAAVFSSLEKKGVIVTDIAHPEDVTVADMLQRAHIGISGSRFYGNKRKARRQGRKGGLGNGVAAAARRDGIAADWVLDRLVDHREIPWHIKVELLAPHISEATLRRHYGSNASCKRGK